MVGVPILSLEETCLVYTPVWPYMVELVVVATEMGDARYAIGIGIAMAVVLVVAGEGLESSPSWLAWLKGGCLDGGGDGGHVWVEAWGHGSRSRVVCKWMDAYQWLDGRQWMAGWLGWAGLYAWRYRGWRKRGCCQHVRLKDG